MRSNPRQSSKKPMDRPENNKKRPTDMPEHQIRDIRNMYRAILPEQLRLEGGIAWCDDDKIWCACRKAFSIAFAADQHFEELCEKQNSSFADELTEHHTMCLRNRKNARKGWATRRKKEAEANGKQA